MNDKKTVILLGSPGAGKGTQAELLSEKFGLYLWDTSKIVGRMIVKAPQGASVEVEGKKYFFEEQKKLRKEGKLWDPPFLVYLAKGKIEQLAKEERGVVFVGSPRTLYEGEKIIPLLKKLYGAENMKVLLIEISEKEAVWRNTHRRECELMRHPVLYLEENAHLTKCTLDGSNLVRRKDDTPEIIKTRLDEYKKRTFPLVECFKKEGLEVEKIDGSPPPVDVFQNILKALNWK
jgi:adenylate kinase